MGNHDHQLISGNLFQDLHDLQRGFRVQRTGGFIRQKNIRIIHQCPGNGHTLHLTAGHLSWLLPKLIPEPHLFKSFLCSSAALRLGHTGKGQRQFHIGQNRLVGDQVIILEYKADGMVPIGVPIPIFKLFGGFTVDDQITGGIPIQATDDVEHGGFTASGLTQNGNELTFPEIQIYALEGMDRFFPGKIVLFDIFQLQQWICSFRLKVLLSKLSSTKNIIIIAEKC